MMVVSTSAQTSAPARTCGRDGNRRSTAGRHPAPTRARQRRHHQPLPTGHRQQRDHQHRPRTAFAGDLRDGRTASQALDDRSAERPVSADRPGARSPGWRFARLAVGRGADLLSAARGAHDAGPIARRHPRCRAAWPAAISTRLQLQRGSSQRATARRCRWCPTRDGRRRRLRFRSAKRSGRPVLMAAAPHNPFEHYCSLTLLGKRCALNNVTRGIGGGLPSSGSQERCAPGRSPGLGGRAARPRSLHRGDSRSEQGAIASAQADEGGV
jgi:hypothetical protein